MLFTSCFHCILLEDIQRVLLLLCRCCCMNTDVNTGEIHLIAAVFLVEEEIEMGERQLSWTCWKVPFLFYLKDYRNKQLLLQVGKLLCHLIDFVLIISVLLITMTARYVNLSVNYENNYQTWKKDTSSDFFFWIKSMSVGSWYDSDRKLDLHCLAETELTGNSTNPVWETGSLPL